MFLATLTTHHYARFLAPLTVEYHIIPLMSTRFRKLYGIDTVKDLLIDSKFFLLFTLNTNALISIVLIIIYTKNYF